MSTKPDLAAVAADPYLATSLGYATDDIQQQLKETARSGVQHIMDVLETRYRRDNKQETPPHDFWKSLRAQAYVLYAEMCDEQARELRQASANPNMNF